MYNTEQKNSFMNTIVNDNSYKSYQRIFKVIESIEQRFDKDICDMSVDELMIVMDMKTGTRKSSTDQFICLLKGYVDWCIKNGKSVTSENNIEKIIVTEIDKKSVFRSKYIKDPEELEEMISVVFEQGAFYNDGVDIPKELSIRLCYEGMEAEEIVNLKSTDIDFENNIIKSPIYSEIEYLVSDHIMSLCQFCIEQKEVTYPTNNGRVRTEKLCENNYVLKQRIGTLRGNSPDRPINAALIIRRVKEFCNIYSEATERYKNVTAGKMNESRLFHDIYLAGSDHKKYIQESVKCDILMRENNLSDRNLYERLRQIELSYLKWKETFY